MTERNVTFADLYDYIQECDVTSFGIHTPDGIRNVKFHVYANKLQVNLLFTTPDDDQGLSHANFVFSMTENNRPTMVTIYPCTKPGICNYGAPLHYDINTDIDSENSPLWYDDIPDGIAVRETLMDVLYPYVNPVDGVPAAVAASFTGRKRMIIENIRKTDGGK